MLQPDLYLNIKLLKISLSKRNEIGFIFLYKNEEDKAELQTKSTKWCCYSINKDNQKRLNKTQELYK